MRIAFFVEKFPVVSETFIIDQVADLKERGIDVDVFAFQTGDREAISDRFHKAHLSDNVQYLHMPESNLLRILAALPKIVRLLKNPGKLFNLLNIKKYGRDAASLRLLYWNDLLANKKFDLAHCHNGAVANKYVVLQKAFNFSNKFVTSFYGSDVSRDLAVYGSHLYDRLQKECSLFFVMSEDMKRRIVPYGFDEKKVVVHPIGIDLNQYKFSERTLGANEQVEIISVGRFVEKKGFDDLLRALALVREKITTPFHCTIIGDGELKDTLLMLTKSLKLENVVTFKGYMKIEEIIKTFYRMHFFVQPSKTARDGNME